MTTARRPAVALLSVMTVLASTCTALALPPVFYVKRAAIPAPDKRVRIEVGALKFPDLEGECMVLTCFVDSRVQGVTFKPVGVMLDANKTGGVWVGMNPSESPLTSVFLSTRRYSFNLALGSEAKPVPQLVLPKIHSETKQKHNRHEAVIEIQGQMLTGTLHIAPLKKRDGSWVDPSKEGNWPNPAGSISSMCAENSIQ